MGAQMLVERIKNPAFQGGGGDGLARLLTRLDESNPRGFESSHLDAGERIVQLLGDRSHVLHALGMVITPLLVVIEPMGEMTAAVPHSPPSANSATSSSGIGLSSVSRWRISLATYNNERRVIDGRIEGLLGVTTLLSLVTNMKFAPPASST